MPSKTQITLHVSPAQLVAYGEAAVKSGTSRHAWTLGVIMAAAGLRRLPQGYRAGRGKISPVPRTESLVLKMRDVIAEAAQVAADDALIPLRQWCVLMLDAAAGISYLSQQINRLKK